MEQQIKAALEQVERQEAVRVLYAVESGSRAWGFASADSDWDVRFICLRPPEWCLSLQNRRDVLEYPLSDDLDVSGWDLRKALRLFAKSNPPLLEWLRSPIVYREVLSAIAKIRELSSQFFSARSCMHHYLRMGEGNFRESLRGERVRLNRKSVESGRKAAAPELGELKWRFSRITSRDVGEGRLTPGAAARRTTVHRPPAPAVDPSVRPTSVIARGES